MLLLLLLGACREKLEVSCDTRVPFYPDADGDGLGERTDLYLGCHPPPGWVAVLEPLDTASSAGDTGAR
jgi:hypothetical protein